MSDLLIRDVPDEVIAALTQKASAANLHRQDWLRAQLVKLAAEPIITERYAYRAYSASGSKGMIKRHSDHPNGTTGTFEGFTVKEMQALKQAEDLIRRNGPGDREKAVAILQGTFEEVMEVPV